MYETAIPMGKMLNAFLAIHGRCKFIIFLRGQTPSLSAPTLILSLMEHFQGKAKNTVKHSIKSTFSISIQINCNWLPGNPQLPPYIYIYISFYIYLICTILLLSLHFLWFFWGPRLESWCRACTELPWHDGSHGRLVELVETPQASIGWFISW